VDFGWARFVNHSRTSPNLTPILLVDEKGEPAVVLVSIRAIKRGEELWYDYGERRKDVIKKNQWLKT
jgi:SET domain-containing protein